MQDYVNIDWENTMSIVGLVGEPGHGILISEARYLQEASSKRAEIAIIVDENYNNLGIATHMVTLLKRLGKDRGIRAFTAEVLFSNYKIMRVFKKVFPNFKSVLEDSEYSVVMPMEHAGEHIHT